MPRVSRMLRSLLVVSSLVAAAGFAASTASAAANDVTFSSNWAGYAVSGTNTTTAAPVSFSVATGTWTQPAAVCTVGRQTWSSFWVGIGGFSLTAKALEQIGTESDCTGSGLRSYTVWYELVPAAAVPVRLRVAAGDVLTAVVVMSGNRVTLRIKNATKGTVFTKNATLDAPDVTSAEWVAEAPSACDSGGHCQVLPLTNFGTVPFTSAAAIGDGHTGTILDGAWTSTGIELITPAENPLITEPVATGAVPSDVSPDGTSFSISFSDNLSRPTAG